MNQKPKRVYQNLNPSDARIFIDIKNHKVSFEYPSKSSSFWIVFQTMLFVWMLLILIFLIFNLPNIFYFIFISSNANAGTPSQSVTILGIFIALIVIIIILFDIGIIPPIMATFFIITNEKLLRKMPKIQLNLNSFVGGTHSFKTIKKPNSKVYELPIFNNVFLYYKATKDFSKYLKKIEVTEHDFNYLKQHLFRKTKTQKQTDYWKARFIFDKIPKTGQLKLEWV